MDDLLPGTLYDALQCGFYVLGALLLISIAVPVILPVFVPLIGAFVYVRCVGACACVYTVCVRVYTPGVLSNQKCSLWHGKRL